MKVLTAHRRYKNAEMIQIQNSSSTRLTIIYIDETMEELRYFRLMTGFSYNISLSNQYGEFFIMFY